MKIRTDFVTNSSSSCFVLAYRDGFSKETQKALLDYVEDVFLGQVYLSADDATAKEQLMRFFRVGDRERLESAVDAALKEHKDIHVGCVHFENVDDIADFYRDIWNILCRTEPGFEVLEGSLDY